MTTPRYVAKKVADQYVLVREDLKSLTRDDWFTIAGGAIAFYGAARMLRRSGGSIAIMLAGGALLYRGMTGSWKPVRSARDRRGNPNQAPSYPHDDQARSPQMPADDVDEASMESFPASDSPAHGREARS